MNKVINITSNGIKQAIDDLVNENDKLQEEIKRLKEDYMILQNASDKVEEEKDKEIERLNNIINGIEKYINENYIYDEVGMKIFDASILQDKLQELKGSGKEC
ncbi:MAG: hypothetical protein IIZ67_07270 [Bacilli bacterium]|nr:hypothetical protein [Bacilli bacterium]